MRYKRYRGVSQGQITIKRLCPELYITNSTVAGTPQLVNSFPSGVQVPISLGSTSVSSGGGYLTPFAFRFSADMLQNISEANGLFDTYRINWVKVFITYNHNVSTAGSGASLPQLYYMVDHDDDVVIGPGALRERMGLKQKQFSSNRRTVAMFTKPKMLLAARNATTTTVSDTVVTRARFIDLTSSDVEHFGFKGFISNAEWPSASYPVTSFKIDVQMSLTLRGVI